VPQTWQKAAPGARFVPHFEQNMETPWVRRMDFRGDVTGCGEMKEAIRAGGQRFRKGRCGE
jgi:hypothetical protein